MIGVIAVMVGVYLPGLQGGFVFDDFPNLVENAALKVDDLRWATWSAAAFSSEAGSLQRPISMLSFASNYYFTGFDPAAMKWTNIAIHGINTLLVLGLTRKVLALGTPKISFRRRQWASVFVAAAWALHPINYMSVLYIVQRMESLAHLFVFAGLLLYLWGRQKQLDGESGRALIGIGLGGGTALGILCKESAALLPLYAWLVEVTLPMLWKSPQRMRVQLLFAAVLWLPLAAGLAWLLPRVMSSAAYASRDFTLYERLLTECRVLVDYLEWSIAPRIGELTLYHDDYVVSTSWFEPFSTTLSAMFLLALTALGWWLRHRRPLTTLGIFWFFAAHTMTATVIPLELVFEHRNYFALVGICLILSDWLIIGTEDTGMRRIGPMLAAAFVLGLGTTTHLRAWDWQDPMRFARTEALKSPASPRAMYQYGRMLVIATEYKSDSPYLNRAIETLEKARNLPKSGILPHSALLLLASNTKMPQRPEWWSDMQARLRENPIGAQEINALASLVRCARDSTCDFAVPEMVATFEAAMTHQNADIYNIYADYLFNVPKHRDDAVALFRKSMEMRPDIGQYRINLIKVLIALGRVEEATREIGLLRQMGKLGQYDDEADRLEARASDRNQLE